LLAIVLDFETEEIEAGASFNERNKLCALLRSFQKDLEEIGTAHFFRELFQLFAPCFNLREVLEKIEACAFP